ncbi:MAG: hypothetical protein JWN70_5621 [Planctomycetaceae bacterium]|nr:hypothetical protein [Planctomycetaceae bacterium]
MIGHSFVIRISSFVIFPPASRLRETGHSKPPAVLENRPLPELEFVQISRYQSPAMPREPRVLIIDRTQRAWATLSAVVCAVAGGAYVCYANWSVSGPSGGSVPGLIFGSIAAAMMIFAGLLAARRRFPAARIGSAQFWMKGHLWIGTLTVPFALFHAGFGLGGRVEILLWILFFGVILSGFWGLLLQQLLPRIMFENVPRETFIEQIPHLCDRFTAESDCLLADVCGPLEVSITPFEIKQYESHWKPHFDEDRKKNRNDYPKTASDAIHFQKFLGKVYVGAPTPVPASIAEPPQPTVASAAPPVMKSVAQIKAPEAPPPTDTAEATAAKPKPDPKAMLAAMKAKSAGTTEPVTKAASVDVPEDSHPAPVTPPAAAKPDPRAMMAAAKAKKAQEAAAAASPELSPTPDNPPATTEATAPAKPDPKAMMAAARAKKAAAEAALATPEPATATPADPPVAEAPAKPDPKAMLAAAKAKREAAAAAAASPSADLTPEPAPVTPVDVPVAAAPAKPDPKAMMAAAKAKREAAAAAAITPSSDLTPEPVAAVPADAAVATPPAKPDPKAMMAAAKAKREAAAAGAAPSTPVPEPSPAAEIAQPSVPQAPAGKPDPKAMMAAMKAKKEAAAQQAGTTSAAAAPPAAKANPLAQLKAVKEPPAEVSASADLIAAAKGAPPTPVQIKELKLFYLELIRPQLPLQPVTQNWREAIRRSIMVCQIRSDNQHPAFTPILDHLLDRCEQRRQFAMIQRYHFWLHGWLLVHIPVTVALYVVLVVHAIVALRVVPFGN